MYPLGSTRGHVLCCTLFLLKKLVLLLEFYPSRMFSCADRRYPRENRNRISKPLCHRVRSCLTSMLICILSSPSPLLMQNQPWRPHVQWGTKGRSGKVSEKQLIKSDTSTSPLYDMTRDRKRTQEGRV